MGKNRYAVSQPGRSKAKMLNTNSVGVINPINAHNVEE